MNIVWNRRNAHWKLSVLSLFLLTVGLRGCPLSTQQQPVSVINEGLDRHLKTLLVSDRLDDPTNDFDSAPIYPTLQSIGRREGFTVKVVTASPTVWIRDDFVALSNGTMLAPSSDPRVKYALEDLGAYRVPADHVYATSQGRVASNNEIAGFKSDAHRNGLVIHDSRVYLEGGNVLVVPKANGSKGVLIGMSSLLTSTFLLDREGTFVRGTSFSDKLEATKKVIAQELGVNPSQVTYLDQLDYHLDMFLTPGANGQVFIEDPDASNATVNALLKDPGLSEEERNELKGKLYPNTSTSSDDSSLSTLRAQLKPTIDELWAAGYQVIGIPGKYNPKPAFDTNFMNGLMANGPDGTPYYITGQSPTTPLNKAFQKVMADYGMRVFFVPDIQGLIEAGGSIHCVTTEQIKPEMP